MQREGTMNNLPTRKIRLPKEEYNKEPVFYCADCLSLAIMGVTGVDDASYCDKCGSTNIKKASIDEWQSLYEKKYGFKFLNNTY